jgi:uncharacterized protein (TIGR00369 family)
VANDDYDDYMAQASAALAAGDLVAASAASRKAIPIQDRMGVTFVRVDADGAVLTMEVTDEVKGPRRGTVHGGILATFADLASAAVLRGAYDPMSDIPVTTDLHVRYYRQPEAGPLTAEAAVVHAGRRLLSTECSIVDARNRTLARSTATYMLVSRQPDGG